MMNFLGGLDLQTEEKVIDYFALKRACPLPVLQGAALPCDFITDKL